MKMKLITPFTKITFTVTVEGISGSGYWKNKTKAEKCVNGFMSLMLKDYLVEENEKKSKR